MAENDATPGGVQATFRTLLDSLDLDSERAVERYDADGDGQLRGDERRAAREGRRERTGGERGERGERGHGRSRGQGRGAGREGPQGE